MKQVLNEATWRRFERSLAARERPRLIRLGFIKPRNLKESSNGIRSN
jgi:hypothetical protein